MSTKKPKIHLIGNAHLDPIWLWRWQEGCGEVLQTFRSALDRMNEYDDFIFTCSSAAYYKWVEEIDQAMFEEITARVKEGRWVPVNGWWVQPDCNMPSGESFARQALYSQLYYYEKFGLVCRTGYNVDSFGHNAMLPQLLKLGGMDTYVMMRPNSTENPHIPTPLFWWQSPDGSKVLTYRIPNSYCLSGEQALDTALDAYEQLSSETQRDLMLFYGVGNHGGGPTRFDIDYLCQKSNEEAYRNIKFSSPDQFFKDIQSSLPQLPVWSEDLQHHASGCYSVVSSVKKSNRYNENNLINSEKWNTIAAITTNIPAQTESFAKAWQELSFNQFHDTLAGCSIREAYDDVRDSMGYAATIAAKAQNRALLSLSRRINTWIDGVSEPVNNEYRPCTEVRHNSAPPGFPRPVVICNPLSFAVQVPVQSYQPSSMVKDHRGNVVVHQNVRSSRLNDTHADTVFMASVPGMGYATYWLYPINEEGVINTQPDSQADNLVLSNEYMRVQFDRKTGCIVSLTDSESDNNYLADLGARPVVIDDQQSDTWAHDVFQFHKTKGFMELQSMEMEEKGPLRSVLRAEYRYGHSALTQRFILAAGQKTLRVVCKAIWQEPHTLLKFSFPVAGTDEISTYEIPYGYIKRPCNCEEEPALSWADVTVSSHGVRRGISILSDSKYSYDCIGSDLRLTALRNAIFADHYSGRPASGYDYTDEGLHWFEYGIYLHTGEAEGSAVVREAALFNNRPVVIPESYHVGAGEPQEKSFLAIQAPNVLASAFKFCEDGSGAVILRCYETAGIKTTTVIQCLAADSPFTADFHPHEIKTFRINPDGAIMMTDFLEGVV